MICVAASKLSWVFVIANKEANDLAKVSVWYVTNWRGLFFLLLLGAMLLSLNFLSFAWGNAFFFFTLIHLYVLSLMDGHIRRQQSMK